MMSKYWIILFYCLLQVNCSQKIITLKNLGGYWEIDRVEKDGEILKQYNFNAFIEYFQIKDSIGFRMKLKPSFAGKYTGNLEKNYFRITPLDSEHLKIDYKNSKLKDEFLQEVTSERITISNTNGITYFYKKYIPIQLP